MRLMIPRPFILDNIDIACYEISVRKKMALVNSPDRAMDTIFIAGVSRNELML